MRWLALAMTSVVLAQTPTFRTNVRLVQVSVVVHDKAGAPVDGLTAADFALLEDGKPQSIELFSIQRAAVAMAPAAAPGAPAQARSFSNRIGSAAGGSVTVILFDRLNTTDEHQMQAREQIIKVLASLNPADRVALYVLESDRVRVLHDFTSDARGLIRVLSRYLATTSIALAAVDEPIPEFAKTGDAAFDAETEAWLQQTQERVSAFFNQRRGESTADALEAIGNHLAGIRGRKNLIWVSSAFPLVINDIAGPRNLSPEINRATRAINNADVAVYPVDARGLIGAFSSAPGARTQTFTTLATTAPNMDTMYTVAENTGGRVFVNTNAIGDAVRRAMDDGRITYTLGYYPTNTRPDDRFREIKVQVKRTGLDVRHRKGYIAVPPQPKQSAESRSDSLTDVIRSPLDATGIDLTARIDRAIGQSAASGSLVVQVDARSLTWEKRGDEWQASLDVLIGQTTVEGSFFKTMDRTLTLTANDERYAQMQSEGFTLTHAITLQDQARRLHIVVRDVPSRTTGSLSIPTGNLQP